MGRDRRLAVRLAGVFGTVCASRRQNPILHLLAKARISAAVPDFSKLTREQITEAALILGCPVSGLRRITAGMDVAVIGYEISFPRKITALNRLLVKQLDLDQNAQLARAFPRLLK